jgi:hypothetical protein
MNDFSFNHTQYELTLIYPNKTKFILTLNQVSGISSQNIWVGIGGTLNAGPMALR